MGSDGLTQLKVLFAAFAAGLLLIMFVVVLLRGDGPADAEADGLVGAVIVAVAGVGSFVIQRVAEVPLDCASDESLARSYKARFFIRLAVSESVALVALVMAIVTKNIALYPLGLAFTAVGFVRAWPGDASLQRDQDELAARGCSRSLVDVLGV